MTDAGLKRKYLNVRHSGSFAGAEKFRQSLNKKYTKEKISNVLSALPAYVRAMPSHKKFKRRRVLFHGIDDQWVMDLIEITKKNQRDNDGHCFY